MAPPLCGPRAGGKRRRGRSGGGDPAPRSARSGGFRELRTYTRYPHYPQVDSPFTARIFVTLCLRGRDDLPATGDSLPSHSPSGNRAGRLRAARRMEAEGRAADEAAARRKLRACPLANAKAACFEKRPRNPGGLRARGGPFRDQEPSGSRNRTGRTPGFGPGPARRKARLRPARRHRRRRSFGSLSFGQDRKLRLSGAAKRQGPRTSVDGPARRNQGFGPGSRGKRNQRLRPEEPPRREDGLRSRICQAANRQGFGPDGEPAGKLD
jgi:hypothetical protein